MNKAETRTGHAYVNAHIFRCPLMTPRKKRTKACSLFCKVELIQTHEVLTDDCGTGIGEKGGGESRGVQTIFYTNKLPKSMFSKMTYL